VPDAEKIASLLERVRQQSPLIHNITNNVVINDSADAILAVGATQATVHNVEEARELASLAAAVAINLGTPSELWTTCARTAVDTATELGTPWDLDPVAVGLLPYRTDLAHEFLAKGPTAIKGNASEILAFAGEDATTHGADSQHHPDQALEAAVRLAKWSGSAVGVTGAVDVVTDGERVIRLSNGDPIMPHVVGTGCMLTSISAAFLAVADDAVDGMVAAISAMSVASELAAAKAAGPGTMKPLLLDALYGLDAATLAGRMKLA